MARRKISFYQLRPTRVTNAGWIFDTTKFISELNSLAPNKRRVFPASENGMIAEAIKDVTHNSIRFGRCRRIGLPLIEKGGVFSLDTVDNDESRAEATHLVFFKENVIGAEVTRDGLRPSSLIEYLKAISPDLMPENKRLRCSPLYEKGTLDYLDSAKQVRSVEIKFAGLLQPSVSNQANPGPEEQLANIARGFQGARAGFSLSNLDGLDGSGLKDFVSNVFGTYSVSVAKATIRLEDDQITIVDLIKGHIGTEKDIELENGSSGSVKPSSAYEAIIEAYGEFEHQIMTSVAAYQEGDINNPESLE
ncbi:MAG: hypothetical protein O3A93_00390 [Chloroflexi bacterium]|nr:hypothetical protein [Chloroflexota bacterium]MDA1269705.1 hypothetical protein [Chloroflexota bacterium]